MNQKAILRAATITIALIAAFVIASEVSSGVKHFFALFGHHWAGKSIVLLVVFGLAYLLMAKSEREYALKDVWLLIAAVVLGGLVIACFYTWHAL